MSLWRSHLPILKNPQIREPDTNQHPQGTRPNEVSFEMRKGRERGPNTLVPERRSCMNTAGTTPPRMTSEPHEENRIISRISEGNDKQVQQQKRVATIHVLLVKHKPSGGSQVCSRLLIHGHFYTESRRSSKKISHLDPPAHNLTMQRVFFIEKVCSDEKKSHNVIVWTGKQLTLATYR